MDLKKNAPKGEFLAYINKEEAALLKKHGGSGKLVNGIPSFRPQDLGQEAASQKSGFNQQDTSNPYSQASQQANKDLNDRVAANHAQRQRDALKEELSITPFNRNKPLNKFQLFNNKFQKKANIKLAQRRAFQKYQDIEKYADIMDEYGLTAEELADKVAKDPSYGYNFSDLDIGKKTLGSNIGTSLEKYRTNLYDVNSKTKYSMIQAMLDKTRKDTQVTAQNTLNKARDYNTLAGDPNISRDKLEALANRGKTPEQINPPSGGDSNQPFIPINYNTGAAEEAVEPYTNDFTYRFGDDQNVIYDNYGDPGYRTTRAADGGIMGTRARRAMGGIMNRVDKRQQFFLGGIGKAIGKVAKAAGKVLSSDVGKMALAGAAFYYGGGGTFAPGGSSTFKMGNFFSKQNPLLFSAGTGKNLGKQVFNPMKFAGLTTLGGFLAGPAKPNEDIGMGERGGRMIDPLTGEEATPAEMRENIELAKLEAGDDADKLAAIDQKYNNMLNLQYQAGLPDATPYNLYGSSGYRTTRAATGGRIGRAEGGLMDLGGMEKDYRAEGGFVPIGEYEKKDDVPARLSVNEFVMTADAVRGAGQGDIDKGAEIMENMMENLENGGTVSEESQGNKGAQNMFKTSERLGAVI